MLERHLDLLACPVCGADLLLKEATVRSEDRVESGMLGCSRCAETFPIVDHVPRFVPAENYARNFGYQWLQYAETQYDSWLGLDWGERRFRVTTGWPQDLSGEHVLEAGCGAGRFTEVALASGATLVSFDFSSSVDVNQRRNGASPRLLVVQGDVFRPPVKAGRFDRVFCMGVLQHTPDPEAAFRSLLPFVVPGGAIAIDVYLKKGPWRWLTSYRRYRWFTRYLRVETVHAVSTAYVDALFPLAKRLWRSGKVGRWIARYVLLMKDRFGRKGIEVTEKIQKDWLVLHLIDQLSAYHDKPQSIPEVRRWLEEASLEEVEVFHGGNGVIARGRMPARGLQ
jgi:SAM-dependent methyltransferase